MNKKIRVAYIFHKNNIFLSGDHFDNTYYNFFIKALGRNPEAGAQIQQNMILAIAFTEAIAIYALVVAIIIKFV